MVTSDEVGQRFEPTILHFDSNVPGDLTDRLTIDRANSSHLFQHILGWGGAFTDSAGINIASLSGPAQNWLLRSYYEDTGLDYNIGRTNIGGCDFSNRTYTYDDVPGDVALNFFELQEEDLVYKIPYMIEAKTIKNTIKYFASPWTAPPWMKDNNDYSGQGHLLPNLYGVWAEYFVKFLDEYKVRGVEFWGLTPQNEPEDGNIPDFSFNCMGWNTTTMLNFIANYLGPTLELAGYGDIDIIMHDDQRPYVHHWAQEILSDPRARSYVKGIGLHWYIDEVIQTANPLDTTHADFPDHYLFYTEACTGAYPTQFDPPVSLGNWHRAERYLRNILTDLNHWVVGWTDWNLALDLDGGPNWADNPVDAPIIVNATSDEFYKQPMFYALGHVSRYLSEGSFRIAVEDIDGTVGDEAGLNLLWAGVKRIDDGVAVTFLNEDDVAKTVNVVDAELGFVQLDIGPKSFTSIVYWP